MNAKTKQIVRAVVVVLVILAAVGIDQLTKFLAFHFLPTEEDYFSLIPGWLGFSHVENDAIAFGIGSGNRPFMIGVMIVTAVFIVGIPALIFTVFKGNMPAQIALGVIEGGAIGNFIDRLFVKNTAGVAVVRDFVDLSRFGFANCNIADFCITIGAAVLLFIIFFIGPTALIPLTKAWREEAKRREAEKEGAKALAAQSVESTEEQVIAATSEEEPQPEETAQEASPEEEPQPEETAQDESPEEELRPDAQDAGQEEQEEPHADA